VRPAVLSIAGSDSSGGAGIQADIKAIEANGCHAATAITAITAQNSVGVHRAEVLAPDLVRDQIRAVLDDLDVRAIKSGMLGNAAVVRAVADTMARWPDVPYVLDPVMVSQTGHALFDAAAIDELKVRLFPRAWVVTPNVHEAQVLAGLEILGPADARRAGEALLRLGPRAVLVKGGHFRDRRATDVLVTADGTREYEAQAIDTPHTHGTGCTYASAVAAQLARGRSIADAIDRAKSFITGAIAHGAAIGRGPGPTDPFHAWRRGDPGGNGPPSAGTLHVLTDETLQSRWTHEQIARMAAEGGADTIQLREKRVRSTDSLVAVARAITRSIRPLGVRLVIDDRVDVALLAGADGVHLGAGDCDTATARARLGPQAIIGVTVHDLERAGRAEREPADYAGVGAVFGTSSKGVRTGVLGLDGLREIAARLAQPVIAIGGIDPARVASVLAAGASGIAVLSSVVCAPDPRAATRALRDALDRAGAAPARGAAR